MFDRILYRLSAISLALVAALALFAPQQAQAQAFTDFAENKITDAMVRAQALGTPATWYVALFNGSSSLAALEAGTITNELSGTNYARASFTPSLANWSSTQTDGGTTASTGTDGSSGNNGVITFATPGASWGTATYWCLMDAATVGNPWLCAALDSAQVIGSGNTVSFAINALRLTVQ